MDSHEIEERLRRERALARRSWPVRKFRLGEEPPESLLGPTTAEERIAMVWQLTLDAWASAGLPTDSGLPRHRWPVTVIRLEDDR